MRLFLPFSKNLMLDSDILISNILHLCCISLLFGTASVHSQVHISKYFQRTSVFRSPGLSCFS